jgi:hypothetical protein
MEQQTAAQPTNHQQHAGSLQQQLLGELRRLYAHKTLVIACRQHFASLACGVWLCWVLHMALQLQKQQLCSLVLLHGQG